MSVIVTGATGFLGNNLVRGLIAKGINPTCLKRPGELHHSLSTLPVTWDEVALGNPEGLRELIASADTIFHCAAKTGTARYLSASFYQSNVELTRALLEASISSSVRFVHCSSVATCAVSDGGQDVCETSPWNLDKFGMDDPYTLTKKTAENLVLEYTKSGVDAVVVNPSFMFGPNDIKLGSCRLIRDVLTNKLPGYPPGANNFVDVRNVVNGLQLAATKGRRGERYILGGENLGYRELFAIITRVGGVKPINQPLSGWLSKIVAGMGDLKERLTGRESLFNSTGMAWSAANCRFSSEKAQRELGYSATSLEQAIQDTCVWFRQNGYL